MYFIDELSGKHHFSLTWPLINEYLLFITTICCGFRYCFPIEIWLMDSKDRNRKTDAVFFVPAAHFCWINTKSGHVIHCLWLVWWCVCEWQHVSIFAAVHYVAVQKKTNHCKKRRKLYAKAKKYRLIWLRRNGLIWQNWWLLDYHRCSSTYRINRLTWASSKKDEPKMHQNSSVKFNKNKKKTRQSYDNGNWVEVRGCCIFLSARLLNHAVEIRR